MDHNYAQSSADQLTADAVAEQLTRRKRSTSRAAKRAAQTGGLAVAAWLTVSLAAGHGVAAADETESNVDAGASTSEAGRESGASESGVAPAGASESGRGAAGFGHAARDKLSPKTMFGQVVSSGGALTSSRAGSDRLPNLRAVLSELTKQGTAGRNAGADPSDQVIERSDVDVVKSAKGESSMSSRERSGRAGSVRSTVQAQTRELSAYNARQFGSSVADRSEAALGTSVTVAVSELSSPKANSATLGHARTTVQGAGAVVANASQAVASAVPAGPPAARPLGLLAAVLNPLLTPSPAVPSPRTPSPFAWALLAFARRNFFNQSPEVTDVYIGAQQSNGVITGDIDAVDPDELGKTVQVRASVYAGPAQPRTTGCDCAEIDGKFLVGPYTNVAILGETSGDNYRAPDAVDNTCVYVDLGTGQVTYTGTETGEVTIDGLGTGDLTLVFEGVLAPDMSSERSVAQIDPDLGTGDLKGVYGTVVSESVAQPDGSFVGVLTGEAIRPEVRYVVVRQPEHGTVTVDEITGQFTYTPDDAIAEEGGADSFQVLVTEGRFNVFQVHQPYNGDPVQTINLTVVGTSSV
jgi:hypothetical protein